MADDALQQRLEALEQRINAHEKKGKWLPVIGTVLVPLTIGLSGFWVSSSIAVGDRAVAETNAKVQQVDLISKFMESLVSPEPTKRKLAVKAILIALPLEGPDLVREVIRNDPDSAVAKFARTSLQDRCLQLINALYSPNPEVRKKAAADLIDGWRTSPTVIPLMLRVARENPGNSNGIYNTVAVMTELDRSALVPHKDSLRVFLREASANGTRTDARVQEVENMLR